MVSISLDPFFYITRDDILDLLKSENHVMINHILTNESNMLTTD